MADYKMISQNDIVYQIYDKQWVMIWSIPVPYSPYVADKIMARYDSIAAVAADMKYAASCPYSSPAKMRYW